MDSFTFFIGFCFILISVIIFVTQFRDRAFSKKEFIVGDVKIFCAGIFALLGGLYFIIKSF
ncbi:amino acid transporter [Algoriphagus sp. 4150]|nr:amino acid transporter [Algoriphagus sp. 4150]